MLFITLLLIWCVINGCWARRWNRSFAAWFLWSLPFALPATVILACLGPKAKAAPTPVQLQQLTPLEMEMVRTLRSNTK